MAIELPELPYAKDALAPHISAETIDFHYGAHHATYVKNLNNLIRDTEFAEARLEDIIGKADGGIFNNAAQVWNHTFYWNSLSPDGGGEPTGAAKQVIDLTVKKVAVIPSVSVPHGISALFAFNSEGDFEATAASMTAALEDVQCVEITTATRSVEIDDIQVQEGQVIALLNGKLAISGNDNEQVLKDVLALAKVEESELITFYYGADLSARQANEIADNLRQAYPDQEVEVVEGGQPHYQIIMSIE